MMPRPMIAILLTATTRPLEVKRGDYGQGTFAQGPTRLAQFRSDQVLEPEA